MYCKYQIINYICKVISNVAGTLNNKTMTTADSFFFNSGYFYNKKLNQLTVFQHEDEICSSYENGKENEHEKFLSCIVSMVHDKMQDFLDVFDLEITREEAIAFIREYGKRIYFTPGSVPFSEINKQNDFDGTECFLPTTPLALLLKKIK